MPKLTLVFWKFNIGTSIVAHFIAVEICNLTDTLILVLLLFFLLNLHCISGASRGLLFISPFLMFFLFFSLVGLLGRLAGLSPGQSWACFFYFRLFRVGVFGSYSLGLHLWSGAARKAANFGITDIRVLDHGIRFHACFGLYIDCFLYHFFKVYGFSILLLYFNLNRKLKTFPEVADYI